MRDLSRQSQTGEIRVESRTITHFHESTPEALTVRVRVFFKGTKMLLVPVGPGMLRVVDPYGRQIPNFRVVRTDAHKQAVYWFQEIRFDGKRI